jgi:hypothetical protein
VKPDNLIFQEFHSIECAKSILVDPDSSIFELEQCIFILRSSIPDDEIDSISAVLVKRFRILLKGNGSVPFDSNVDRNGWVSAFGSYLARPQNNADLRRILLRTHSLIHGGILQVWFDLLRKYLNNQNVEQNCRVLYRWISTIFVVRGTMNIILEKYLPLELFQQMCYIAEETENGALQGLAPQCVGIAVEYARNEFQTRDEIVEYFDSRRKEDHQADGTLTRASTCWAMHEAISGKVIKEQVKRQRPRSDPARKVDDCSTRSC